MGRNLLAVIFALVTAPAWAQIPSTPCTPNAGSWGFTTTTFTVYRCASDGLSWIAVAPQGTTPDWTTITSKPSAVSNLSGTNTGDQTITLTGDVTGTGTGSFATAIKSSVSLTTPVIGVATGTSLAVTGLLTSSGTAGIGYATGSGGTVTQLTSKSTGVTLSKLAGTITTHNASLAAATIVTFTVTNTLIAAMDLPVCTHDSGGTVGAYTVICNTSASGSFKITIRNNTAGALVEALVIRFAIVKGATS